MLTVMTYNVGAGLADPLRLVEVLRQSGADIIGLQELAPEQGAAIADLLGGDYPHQVLHPTGIPGKGLISRFPLRETELLELHPGRPDLQAVSPRPMGSSPSSSPIRRRRASGGTGSARRHWPISKSPGSPRWLPAASRRCC